MNDWSNKSDELLVEALRGDDQQDSNLAMQILQDRHRSRLRRFLSVKIPADMVDDVEQEVWIAIYKKIKAEEVKVGFSNLLFGIARNKRADTVRRITIERKIENNEPLTDFTYDAEKEVKRPIEELINREEQLNFLYKVPLIKSLLSDCQRVFWIMRENLYFPSSVIARLTSKNSQTVYSALHSARERVMNYIPSIKNPIGMYSEDLGEEEYFYKASYGEPVFGIERFQKPIIPRLAPEEINAIGLTTKEFKENYTCSLMILWNKRERKLESGPLYLVLTERSRQDSPLEIQEISYMITRLWLAHVCKFEEKRKMKQAWSYHINEMVEGKLALMLSNVLWKYGNDIDERKLSHILSFYKTDANTLLNHLFYTAYNYRGSLMDIIDRLNGCMPEGYILKIDNDGDKINLSAPRSLKFELSNFHGNVIHFSYHPYGSNAPFRLLPFGV